MMEKEMEVHGAETRKSPVSQSLYEHKQDEVDFLVQTQTQTESLEKSLTNKQCVGESKDIRISGGIITGFRVELESIPNTHYYWSLSTDEPPGTEVSSSKEKLKDGTEWHISLTFKANKIKLFLHLKPNCKKKKIQFQYTLVSNGCGIETEKKSCLFTSKLNKHWIGTIKKQKVNKNFLILEYMIEEDSGKLNGNVEYLDVEVLKIPVQTGKIYFDIEKFRSYGQMNN